MIAIDLWQTAAAISGITYTVGNLHQLRVTIRTRETDGLSLPQWVMFFLRIGCVDCILYAFEPVDDGICLYNRNGMLRRTCAFDFKIQEFAG